MQPAINHDYPARWHSSRDGADIVALIAHGTGGTDSRHYLQRGGDLPDGSDRKVSIHSLVQKDGTIYRMVPDERVANHAGGVLKNGVYSSVLTIGGRTFRGAQVNRHTLGLELENLQNGTDPYPEAQLLAMGWQFYRWRQRWGAALPIVRHAIVDKGRRTDTVGLTVATMELWVARAAAGAESKRYRVKAASGANVRQGKTKLSKVVRILEQNQAWEGYETPGQQLTVAGFGTSKLWVCNADGRCVWRPLLEEV